MRIATIGALAFLAFAAMGRPVFAQPQETPSTEAQGGVEALEGVEAAETPGDTGPDVDHQFEGEETGENGSGSQGTGSGR